MHTENNEDEEENRQNILLKRIMKGARERGGGRGKRIKQ